MKYDGIKSTGPKIGDVLADPYRRARPKKNSTNRASSGGRGETYFTKARPTVAREMDALLGGRVTRERIREEATGVEGPDFDPPFSEMFAKKRSASKRKQRSSAPEPEELLAGLDDAIQEGFLDAFLQSSFGRNDLSLSPGVFDGEGPDLTGLL